MVVTENCFLGNVITAVNLVEKFSPENVAVVGLLPLPNKRTNGVEPLIQAVHFPLEVVNRTVHIRPCHVYKTA